MGRRSTAKRIKRDAPGRRAAEGRNRGCLFCRRSDGGFTSPEHVIPESVGNQEIILPNGVVCDRCNHGPLAVLDQVICDFQAVKMRRTMLGIPSKGGTVPVARFSQGSIENIGPSSLVFHSSSDRPVLRENGREGDQVQLRFQATGGRRMTPRYASELSRALLKSALECAWIDHGDLMLDMRYDHARAAVLGEPRFGFFGLVTRATRIMQECG